MSTAIAKGNEQGFVFAGNSTFTLVSGATGNRYTYKVTKAKDREGLYFAKLMTGRDNENDFTYLGIVHTGGVKLTKASQYKPESTPVKALDYFMRHISNVPENLHVYHEGRCCRCGRKLTTPDSIETGVGPECQRLIKFN